MKKKYNRSKKRSLFTGSIVALLIAFSPFFLYIHNSIPEDLENYNTFFGVIKGGEFGTAQVFIFLLLNKLVPLFLLTLLYLTNKDWWSHVILIPIATYIFQSISIISDSINYIDEIEFIYIIPIITIILTPLYFIRKKINIYINALDLKKEMDNVIKK